jgi:hypothetical protein
VYVQAHSPFSFFSDLLNAGDQLSSLDNADIKLNEFWERLPGNLEYAAPESAEIRDYLGSSVINTDSRLLTIGQTWTSLFPCRYSYVEGKGYTLASI